MSDDKEKKVKGYLYSEIARLRTYIAEMYDDHGMELKTWTYKCGQMGNEIGRLRKQLEEKLDLEHENARLQKKLSVKETELQEMYADLEEAQWENLKLKQRLEKKDLEDRLMINKIKKDVEALRLQMPDKEQKTEHQVDVTKEGNGRQLTNTPINSEIMDLTCDLADIKNGTEVECIDCGQINDLEADCIVKTYCSSESEMDGDKKVSDDSVDTNELTQDVQEDLSGTTTGQKVLLKSITEQEDLLENITKQDDSLGNITGQEDSLKNITEQEVFLENITRREDSLGNITAQEDSLKNITEQEDSLENITKQDGSLGNITGQDDLLENITQREDSLENITEQAQRNDDGKQKAKYHFWSTLKKRVSIKSKQMKPTPLLSKVSVSD